VRKTRHSAHTCSSAVVMSGMATWRSLWREVEEDAGRGEFAPPVSPRGPRGGRLCGRSGRAASLLCRSRKGFRRRHRGSRKGSAQTEAHRWKGSEQTEAHRQRGGQRGPENIQMCSLCIVQQRQPASARSHYGLVALCAELRTALIALVVSGPCTGAGAPRPLRRGSTPGPGTCAGRTQGPAGAIAIRPSRVCSVGRRAQMPLDCP
jgi:hypothetical protein